MSLPPASFNIPTSPEYPPGGDAASDPGGGLISGIATAIKSQCPDVRVIGVETAMLPAMKESLAAGRVYTLPSAKTLADGISVAVVNSHTFPIVNDYVETIVTVTEEEIANAIMVFLEREKTLAEGAGAVDFAALYNHRVADITGKKVVVVLSGGNTDITLLSRLIEGAWKSTAAQPFPANEIL